MTIKLTISTESGQVFVLEVDNNENVENVKALIEVESTIPLMEQGLLFNGNELASNQTTLASAGVKDNDLIFVVRKRQQPQRVPAPAHNVPQANNFAIQAKEFQNYVRSNPNVLQQLFQNDPQLAEAVLNDDVAVLTNVLMNREMEKRRKEAEELRRIQLMNMDPLNPEYQKLIAEEIRMNNINENMEQAIEHMPESFARVIMLYIDITVNNVPVKAFVDSGAQQTIMSVKCAEKCGIMRLVDTRYKGIAKGVGTAKIIGRVHMAPLKIGNSFFPCSFTILEEGIDFLLGLDMLRRHQCTIDLKANVLRIGEEAVNFLSEKDIPKSILFDDGNADPQDLTHTPSPGNQSTATSTPPTKVVMPPLIANPPSKVVSPPAKVVSPPTKVTSPPVSSSPFPETTISQLMSLGFSRDEVIQALRMANGNAEVAASVLFSNSGMGF